MQPTILHHQCLHVHPMLLGLMHRGWLLLPCRALASLAARGRGWCRDRGLAAIHGLHHCIRSFKLNALAQHLAGQQQPGCRSQRVGGLGCQVAQQHALEAL